MKTWITWCGVACLFVAGCASSKPKQATPPTAEESAQIQEQAREAKDKPPVRIGPDIIVPNDPSDVWAMLTKVDAWGSWMKEVTKAQVVPAFSVGSMINWNWDKKIIQSQILTITENQEFDFQSTTSSTHAIVRWSIKSLGPNSTLISLRAELPYGASQKELNKLGPEMSHWITELQMALAQEAQAQPTPTPSEDQ